MELVNFLQSPKLINNVQTAMPPSSKYEVFAADAQRESVCFRDERLRTMKAILSVVEKVNGVE